MDNETKVVRDTTNEEITGSAQIEGSSVPPVNTVTPPPAGKRCPRCQALVTAEQAFCPDCGAPLKKFCANCNAELHDGQAFCPTCGHSTAPQTVAPAAINNYNAAVAVAQKKPNTAKIVLGVIAAILICVGLVFMFGSSSKDALHDTLMSGEWTGLDDEGDTLLYLNFSEDEIDYSGYFGVLGRRTVGEMEYEVVDGDTIIVHGREINVVVSKNGNSVTFSPSFIDSRSSNTWTK